MSNEASRGPKMGERFSRKRQKGSREGCSWYLCSGAYILTLHNYRRIALHAD